MQPANGEPEESQELVPLNAIRVETGLSSYPVHRLAKQGTADIEIRERSPNGEVVIQWKVSHNSSFGQPGPLAYKIDTLIVNRRIEEAGRPIPRLIKLGSQAAIAQELGISTHATVSTIKRALYQNASAFITAKIQYKLKGRKTSKDLEAGFTRYNVVFTGEELPDGRRADAVYVVLSDIFMQVLNGAETRPLDYDYLKDLPPASQRLYELLSYKVFGALNNKRKDARLSYSEFCTYAPLIRCLKWDQVRPQMARIHRPHLKSGYIKGVRFEQTSDRDGKPDWVMVYVPGLKAKAEFQGFAVKGGPRILELESPTPLFDQAEKRSGQLERELIERGVKQDVAAKLVSEHPEERIRRQLEQLAWRCSMKRSPDDPAAYLVAAITEDYPAPAKFESQADKAKREGARRDEMRRSAEETQKKQATRAAEMEQLAQIDAYIKGLSPEARAKLDRDALEHTAPDARASYEGAKEDFLKAPFLRLIRDAYVRRLLKLPEPADG